MCTSCPFFFKNVQKVYSWFLFRFQNTKKSIQIKFFVKIGTVFLEFLRYVLIFRSTFLTWIPLHNLWFSGYFARLLLNVLRKIITFFNITILAKFLCRSKVSHTWFFTFEDLEKIWVIRLLEALSHPPSKQVKAALPAQWRRRQLGL